MAPRGNKNAVGNKGGARPTTYKPEYCAKVIGYGKRGKSKVWIATELNVHVDTLDNWAKAHPEFFLAISRAKQLEQRWWEDAGQDGMVSDKFNGAIWAKNMSCRFQSEWRDNSKTTIEGGDADKPLRVSWMTKEEAAGRGWA